MAMILIIMFDWPKCPSSFVRYFCHASHQTADFHHDTKYVDILIRTHATRCRECLTIEHYAIIVT